MTLKNRPALHALRFWKSTSTIFVRYFRWDHTNANASKPIKTLQLSIEEVLMLHHFVIFLYFFLLLLSFIIYPPFLVFIISLSLL